MKHFKLFTMLTLTVLMIAANAIAQAPEKITFHAPFEFTVADRPLPAGFFTIRSLSQTRLLIRSDDGRQTFIATNFAAQAKQTPASTEVVFVRYGDQYF